MYPKYLLFTLFGYLTANIRTGFASQSQLLLVPKKILSFFSESMDTQEVGNQKYHPWNVVPAHIEIY